MKRGGSVTVAVIAGVVLGGAGSAWSAPPTKRCIDAAESGQQLRGSGKLMESRKAFGLCTSPSCPAAVRRDCARWIEEVDGAIPTVAVRLEDETGHEITDGKVLLDDETPLQASAGRSVAVDPGAHRFAWMRSDGKIEQEVVIREGERNRTIVLRVAPATTLPPPPPDHVQPTSPGSSSPLPLIVGAIGLAAGGIGAGFWFVGLRDRSNLEQTCVSSHTCAQGDIDSSRTKLIVGDVLVGVGVVALAAAVFIYLRQSNEPARAALR